MFIKSTLFALFIGSCVRSQTANYCARSLCSGSTHIACNHTGEFADICELDREIMSITPYIDFIVTKHNEYRNTVAAGNLTGFLSAKRMGTMQWNEELSYLAQLNVMQCVMKHDKCRNTDRFKWAGQNLSWYWSRPANNAQFAINKGIVDWFDEYEYANMSFINSYQSNDPNIGHFTPMINDRSIRIGCAILRQSLDDGIQYFFACNYSQTNINKRKIYASGSTASRCIMGTNPSYPALCSELEPINPNTVLS